MSDDNIGNPPYEPEDLTSDPEMQHALRAFWLMDESEQEEILSHAHTQAVDAYRDAIEEKTGEPLHKGVLLQITSMIPQKDGNDLAQGVSSTVGSWVGELAAWSFLGVLQNGDPMDVVKGYVALLREKLPPMITGVIGVALSEELEEEGGPTSLYDDEE